jgi:hypothetical protein
MKRKMTSNERLDIHPIWAHDVAIFIQISWSMRAKSILLNTNSKIIIFKQNKRNVKVWFIHRHEWEHVPLYREPSLC